MIELLEWCAFLGGAVSVFLYPRMPVIGPLCGCCTAILFIVWGFFDNAPAAVFVNAGFLTLHAMNFWRAISHDRGAA